MRKPPYLAYMIAAAVILLVSMAVFRRYLPYTGAGIAPLTPPPVLISMENVRLVGLGGKGKLWSANAAKVEITRDRTTSMLTSITDGKIYQDGKVALKVSAGRAEYQSQAKDLSLSGGVSVEGGDGQKISTQSAVWNSYQSRLRSTGEVGYQNKWCKVTANDLVVDLRSKEMNMTNVRMLINLKAVQAGVLEGGG